jgi:hypothetical protein
MGWFILHPEEKGLILFRIGTNVVRFTMGVQVEKQVYVRVKDGAGNQFLCPIDALKEVREATGEELENCVDNAVAERYAGEIEVADK